MRHLVLLAFHFIVCCKPSPLEVAFDSEHPAEFKILINGSPWLKEDLSYGSRIFVRDVHKLRNACSWDLGVINGKVDKAAALPKFSEFVNQQGSQIMPDNWLPSRNKFHDYAPGQREITLRDSLQNFITLHKTRSAISLRLVQNACRN